MSYEIAKNKAWGELGKFNFPQAVSVKFLADEYTVDLEKKEVFSLSCNIPAKDFTVILILHYLAQKSNGLPLVTGEWLTFREFSGIEGYYAAFKQRSIEPIVRKYGKNPEGIFSVIDRLAAKKAQGADAGIIIEAFEGVPVLVKLWKADEDFSPDANMFFDRSISKIFCIEDIVVLAGIIAGKL
ncbi:MAG: DUF3786 domain-containing protein [Candidatus Omnitrophica bacterium]|nr:DUF3786 domain-containing protein [Candidatus Omnitrophota bacterium]